MGGFNRAFQGRTLPPLPPTLSEALERYIAQRGASSLTLAIRQGETEALPLALKQLRDSQEDLGLRVELAKTLAAVKYAPAERVLLDLAVGKGASDPALQRVALKAMVQFEAPQIANTIAARFDNSISNEHGLRATACRTLAARRTWAQVLLEQVNGWRIPSTDVPPDVIQRLRTYKDDELVAATNAAFGPQSPISSAEKTREILRLKKLLSHAPDVSGKTQGNPKAGAKLFKTQCASCHRLFGEGHSIAPELDAYDRKNLDFWLPAIIAPSLEIREGYQSYLVLTHDDQVYTGMIEAQGVHEVILRNVENELLTIPREDIAELRAIRSSLMPDNLLSQLSEQELRDLFAYLMQ